MKPSNFKPTDSDLMAAELASDMLSFLACQYENAASMRTPAVTASG